MTWLSVREAAQALHVTERAVQLGAQQNKYETRHVNGKGRGGKQLRIALESLPECTGPVSRGSTSSRGYPAIHRQTAGRGQFQGLGCGAVPSNGPVTG